MSSSRSRCLISLFVVALLGLAAPSLHAQDSDPSKKSSPKADVKADAESSKDAAKESSKEKRDAKSDKATTDKSKDNEAPNKESSKVQGKASDTPDSKDDKPVEKSTDEPGEKKTSPKSPSSKSSTKADTKKASPTKKVEAKKEEPKVQVRMIALSGNYVDRLQPGGIDPVSLMMGSVPMKQKSFYRLCDYLNELADDEDLQYVVFDLSDAALSMNSAQLDEFTRRMEKLTTAGKKTIAWLENADNTHLAIAACCKKVFMADFGGLDFSSSALEAMYYRDAMDLIGIKASVVRAGDFKGAVEPYTNSEMSPHLRQHYVEMLRNTNAAQVDRLVRGRGLTTAKVRELQKQRFLTPGDALARGVVDKLAPYGSMKKTIDEMIGKETEWTTPKKKRRRQMSFFEVMSSMMSGPRSSSSRVRDNTIAVLHLSGAIVDGKKSSGGGAIVSGPMVTAIETLIKDEKIKGVVVRVNSPGGSATASESIRQALKKLANKKPTVVSMGRVAASGGYWVSCIGTPIYAEKATITGSIGVFSMKLSFGTLLRRIGVKVETIALDDSAEAFAVHRAWSKEDTTTLSKTIDEVYGKFLALVSEARDIPVEEVRPLAGGRIWSGTQAKAVGLIDEIGGVDDCLAMIAKKAELPDDYQVIHRSAASGGISLMELLGESDENEIFSGLSKTAVRSLSKRGLSLAVTKLLIEDGLYRTKGRPTVWLLNPAEITIR